MAPFVFQCIQKRMVADIRLALLDRPRNKAKTRSTTPGVIFSDNSTRRKESGTSDYLSLGGITWFLEGTVFFVPRSYRVKKTNT